MVYATALHAPVHTGTLESLNEADIRKMPGVIATVRLPNGVAVVAAALRAGDGRAQRAQGDLEERRGGGLRLRARRSRTTPSCTTTRRRRSPTCRRRATSTRPSPARRRSSAPSIRSDYGYHAQMEPLNAVVRVSGRRPVGRGLGRHAGARRHPRRGGQGARHRARPGEGDTSATWAAASAGARSATTPPNARASPRRSSRPVKLIWTREEDIAHGMFRPQSFQCLEAAQDATGKVTGWQHCVVGEGGVLLHTGIQHPVLRGAEPEHRAARRVARHPAQALARGRARVQRRSRSRAWSTRWRSTPRWTRSTSASSACRSRPKARKCFETVAQMCDWKAPRPDGRALGVSVTERSGSLGAGVVEISLDRQTGKIKVHKVWVAVDGGIIVHARRRPRPTSRARSSTGSRACCTSASP